MIRRLVIASLVIALSVIVPARAASHPQPKVETWATSHAEPSEPPFPSPRPPRPRKPRSVAIRASAAPPSLTVKASCASGLVHDLIVADFPANEVAKALTVASRESSCYPYAKNPRSSASGVFQFIDTTWATWAPKCGFAGASVFSATANVGTAACVVAAEGWGPWGG